MGGKIRSLNYRRAGACIGKALNYEGEFSTSREIVSIKGRETRFQDYLKKELNFFMFFCKELEETLSELVPSWLHRLAVFGLFPKAENGR